MKNRQGLAIIGLWMIAGWCLAQGPALQLAQTYEKGMVLQGYWVSEKLDGVRAYWNGEQLISKGGHVIKAPAWFVRGYPDTPMDGELWMGHGRFAEVSAAVRRLQPNAQEWRQIRYKVFDLPASEAPFSQRIQQMKALALASNAYTFSVIEQQPASSHVALLQRLDKVMAAGGEGLMLHHGDSLYQAGRSDAILKVKTYQDAEAVVIGHTEGKGKYRGMLGALVVQDEAGRRFKLGSGFSDAQRQIPPPIGATVTYKYYGLTANELPRFASFLRVRHDEPLAEP
ncbi:DNA ligase [Alcanivorax sp.]|uniref:DNA ligase n=1 Tax=Alcanivorax sp. TaxID=1872427 RepID=UPI000C396243|nr:DNA ligase [Alcanivorax sp.]MBQ23735.1 DNA ligase [Alcanivorax sp.]